MRKKLPQRIDNILKEIRDELKKIYSGRLKEVILFGSYARGDFKEESDIDIILLLKSLKDVSLERQKYFPEKFESQEEKHSFSDKLRMVIEFLLIGWIMLGSEKRRKFNDDSS